MTTRKKNATIKTTSPEIPKVVSSSSLVERLEDIEYALLEIARALSDRNVIERERNEHMFPKAPEPLDAEIFDPKEERDKELPVATRFQKLLEESQAGRS